LSYSAFDFDPRFDSPVLDERILKVIKSWAIPAMIFISFFNFLIQRMKKYYDTQSA
jgi:hypothetical protein